MKFLKVALLALTFAFANHMYAQRSLSEMNDKELSQHFAQQIDELDARIKLRKTQLKADKLNVEYKADLVRLEAEKKKAKADKKVIDKALKSQSKADKAIAKAEKLQQKAEQAKAKAEEAKRQAEEAKKKAAEDARKIIYLRSQQ